jgi:hypothetical protein
MQLFWRGLLAVLLLVSVGLILWLPWPWNLAVGILFALKVGAGIAVWRGLSKIGRRAP